MTDFVVDVTPEMSEVKSAEEKVGLLEEFFGTRLLLKRFRKDVREEAPERVLECEDAFRALAVKAVAQVEAGRPLDALLWLEICADFSDSWLDVCHWVSPKKLREFFTNTIGAEWERVSEVPAAREQPTVDLKWYKYPDGNSVVQPCLCPVCDLVCNSIAQYTAHAQGKNHKTLAKSYCLKNNVATVEAVPCPAGAKGEQRRERGEKKRRNNVPSDDASGDSDGAPNLPSWDALSQANRSIDNSSDDGDDAVPLFMRKASADSNPTEQNTHEPQGQDVLVSLVRSPSLMSSSNVGERSFKSGFTWDDLPQESSVAVDTFLFCDTRSIW